MHACIADDCTAGQTEEEMNLLRFLYKHENRRILVKIIYADEWAKSVSESFGNLFEVSESLKLHYREIEKAKTQINPNLLQLLLSCLPLEK
jgi:hypothetical protein